MKQICDSHVHIGNYEKCYQILNTTKYKNKYKLYDCINLSMIKSQDKYIQTIKKFFAIPVIFKEINIYQANAYVIDYCNKHSNGIPVNIISDYFNIPKYNIWKEHFLLNNYNQIDLRNQTYNYINDTCGFLIIHCKDEIRLEYIKKLHQLYNNINIIIAHLGRDCHENNSFVYNILKKYNNEKIFYDLSTIKNTENLKNAFKMIDNNNIFFGSDYPYDSYENIESLKEKIYLYASNPKDIFINNFEGVVKRLEKSK